jgi:hypothetical protein
MNRRGCPFPRATGTDVQRVQSREAAYRPGILQKWSRLPFQGTDGILEPPEPATLELVDQRAS